MKIGNRRENPEFCRTLKRTRISNKDSFSSDLHIHVVVPQGLCTYTHAHSCTQICMHIYANKKVFLDNWCLHFCAFSKKACLIITVNGNV